MKIVLRKLLIHTIGLASLIAAQDKRGNSSTISTAQLPDHLEPRSREKAEGSRFPDNRPERQQPQTTPETLEEELRKQEEAIRNQQKAVVGLTFAQGAVEITLGAIRIATAGTTAGLLHQEDAIAQSRAVAATSIAGVGGEGNFPEPIRKDAAAEEAAARKQVCDQIVRRSQIRSDDPYSNWNNGYLARMKRSIPFGSLVGNQSDTYITPTPGPHSISQPTKSLSLHEADKLLDLLEKLLNTNNKILHILDIDLPPITSKAATNPGAIILKQYRERLRLQREMEHRYGEEGFLDENYLTSNLREQGAKWKSSLEQREQMHILNSEVSHLSRVRQRLEADG